MINARETKEKINEAFLKGNEFLFVVDFEMEESYFVESPFGQAEILFHIGNCSNYPGSTGCIPDFYLKKHPLSPETYAKKFGIVMEEIKAGNSFLLNLTAKTRIETNLSLKDIFLFCHAPYKLLIKDRFVCFSPEPFVTIKDNTISTFPMKGTIDASIKNAKEIILSDYKETCEHQTIVDLMRNDLNKIADHAEVHRFRYIDHIKTSEKELLQVSSEIRGKLPDDYLLGNIIFSMLPAGSVSGAPKASTLEIIKRAEGERRGFYSGVFGLYDGKEFHSAVIIRYIEQEEGKLYFRSGGGITVNSSCRNEYDELIQKIYIPL